MVRACAASRGIPAAENCSNRTRAAAPAAPVVDDVLKLTGHTEPHLANDKGVRLRDHLIVRVAQQRDPLQRGHAARQQAHVRRHAERDLERRGEQVLRQRLEVERARAAAAQVRRQYLIHHGNNHRLVRVVRQEAERGKVVYERVPVFVGEVDGGGDHGVAVGRGDLGDEAKVEQRELARVRALCDLEQVARVRVACTRQA